MQKSVKNEKSFFTRIVNYILKNMGIYPQRSNMNIRYVSQGAVNPFAFSDPVPTVKKLLLSVPGQEKV